MRRKHEEDMIKRLRNSKFHPRGYLSHHLAAISIWRRSTRTPRTSPTASLASSSAR